MMHAMHVGRDDHQPHDAVEPARHRDIGVIEHRGGVEQRPRTPAPPSAGMPNTMNDRDLDRHRHENLDRMKAHAGGDIDIEIGMMHAVQPPQPRHVVEDIMLGIDHEIEDQEAENGGKPERAPPAGGTGPIRVRPRISAAPTAAVGTSTRTTSASTPGCRDCPASAASRPTAMAGAAPILPTAPCAAKIASRSSRSGSRSRVAGSIAPIAQCCRLLCQIMDQSRRERCGRSARAALPACSGTDKKFETGCIVFTRPCHRQGRL